MSPPEVWGPAVWTLFHTLAEKMHENAYIQLSPYLFNFIVRICKFLPCPDCSTDASKTLASVKLSNYKTKNEFKEFIYLFHNKINHKLRKQLYNYGNINIYSRYNTISVINNFINNYQTKGNMKLLTESFQRKLIITDFKKWITSVMPVFLPELNVQRQIQSIQEPVSNVEEPVVVVEEVVVEETAVEEPVVEETAVEEPVVEETVVEEPVVVVEEPVVEETVVEEPVVEETAVEEPVVEEPAVEEPVVVEEASVEEAVVVEEAAVEEAVVEEPAVVEEEPKKSKKSKKSKK